MKEKKIKYEINLKGEEPEFYMKIGFESLDECLLSIAHRRLSNRGSGLIRHKGNPNGTREISGVRLEGVYDYKENKRDARLYHDTYLEHIERLGLDKLEKEKDFVIISNGNLGNNFWHVAWEHDKDKRLYCLADEPFSEKRAFIERKYSCFIVPKNGEPCIGNVRFNENGDLLDEEGKNLEEIKWLNYGQQIIRDNNVVSIEEIIDQFYDIMHVFDLKDWGETKERDIEIMKGIYRSYPKKFREKMLRELGNGRKRSRYYHSTLGVDDKGIVLYHYYDKIEEIAKRLVDKGVKDSIILDQGGSVGVYASWLYDGGGYLSNSSYFRPNRISTIAFVLKGKQEK